VLRLALVLGLLLAACGRVVQVVPTGTIAVPTVTVAAPTPTSLSPSSTATVPAPTATPQLAVTPAVPTPVLGPTSTPAARAYRIDPARSSASYRVREEFLDARGLFTAVGNSKGVSGELWVDLASPGSSRIGEIVVDVSRLESDDRDRDNALRNAYLESRRFPRATFKNAALSRLPERVVPGQPFTFRMEGDLTAHDVTQRVGWDVEAKLVGDELQAKATTKVKLSDFRIDVPSLLMLKAEDEAELAIEIVATPAVCTATRDDGGPNYRPGAPARAEIGRGLLVSGTVRAAGSCAPLPNARVEVWLTNPQGEYDDAHRTTLTTDANGGYRLQSSMPGAYGGGLPHVHVRVSASGYRTKSDTLLLQLSDREGRLDVVLAPVG
jgi:polyisoprenoid-binding protein YceI